MLMIDFHRQWGVKTSIPIILCSVSVVELCNCFAISTDEMHTVPLMIIYFCRFFSRVSAHNSEPLEPCVIK